MDSNQVEQYIKASLGHEKMTEEDWSRLEVALQRYLPPTERNGIQRKLDRNHAIQTEKGK